MNNKGTNAKKRLVVSYKNLSDELKAALKKQYPNGYSENMIRVDKGPGDFFYAIVLETEEVSYLIKVDVKIDDGNTDEEEDKEYYDDDIKGAEDIIDDNVTDDDE